MICNTSLVESESVLLGMRTTTTMGIHKWIVKGNSMEVINLLKGNLKECSNEIR